ncbi:bifunctional glutamyl/prolyl-tRNA synthetase [Nematocida homosporus]|uniref:bifunctional glutamyl/prolyl-tRNA synthetase n=1 Tax=Nematocida homosporus TaxID=1912981 RepID=UPI0022211D48|nr:bifunctional glutamyl/prolyl-tRNA synthetase [Nematocida homosporus]KAI5185273.1 bifunctional glutamyl/prolyl-tRNA synthetase [Nematocida homosporus]
MSKTQKFAIDATQEEDFPRWYKECITKAEILDYHDINGCYVLRPNGFFIWNTIKEEFTKMITSLEVQEAYFPMLVSKSALEREKDHLADFAPEVAWITECGGRVLENPVAIRPTSEAIMYPYFAKWIQSYRDLPLKVNQWCNVLRWETTQTMPFVRGREFLWQEGHTAHFTRDEADKEVLQILEFYARIYEDLLAVPVTRGRKSKKETFAGADYTTTIEAFVPMTGRGIQAATSHSLGTNFSEMFRVMVEDPKNPGVSMPVFQNSWGLSTRSIGVAILVHSDNRGVVLPPKVAPIQVVVIPCGLAKSTSEEDKEAVLTTVETIRQSLIAIGIRTKVDLASTSPGHKFNHWEVRGVPLRIEVGPKDLKKQEVVVAWRVDKTKKTLPLEGLPTAVTTELNAIQATMYYNAKTKKDLATTQANNLDDLRAALQKKQMATMPWCGAVECEATLKLQTTETDDQGTVTAMGAKSLCIPFTTTVPTEPCAVCQEPSTCIGLFGRSY